MDVTQLVYFAEAAKYQHYTKAAEELYITQPALSQSIKRLEIELGVKLFQKAGQGIRLNENGVIFNEYVQEILSELDQIRQDVADLRKGDAGVVRIGTVLPIKSLPWMQTAVAEFVELHPGVRIQIQSQTQEKLLKMIESRTLDLAVTTTPVPEEYAVRPLYRETLGVLMSAMDPLADRPEIRIADLIGKPIYCNNCDADIHALLQKAFAGTGTAPNIFFEGAYPIHIIDMVFRMQGITFVSEVSYRTLRENSYAEKGKGDLVFRRITDAPLERMINLVGIDEQEMIPAMVQFAVTIQRSAEKEVLHGI